MENGYYEDIIAITCERTWRSVMGAWCWKRLRAAHIQETDHN